MSERALWEYLRPRLNCFGRSVRVENAIDVGTPDVCYRLSIDGSPVVTGWLELKHVDTWPARAATPVHVRSLTIDQVIWHESWWPGACFVLLQVDRSYFLMSGGEIRGLYDGWTRTELGARALRSWSRQLAVPALVRELVKPVATKRIYS